MVLIDIDQAGAVEYRDIMLKISLNRKFGEEQGAAMPAAPVLEAGQPLDLEVRRVVIDGIRFDSSAPLWANPKAGYTRQSMPAILCRPGFMDLLQLCTVVYVNDVIACNRALHAAGELAQRQFEVNAAMLSNIAASINVSE